MQKFIYSFFYCCFILFIPSHALLAAENFIDFIRTPIEDEQRQKIIQALDKGAQTQAMVQYIDGIYHVPFSEDIFEITFYGDNDEIVYVSSDGQYIFQADVIYTPDAVSITRIRREDLAQLKGLIDPPPILEESDFLDDSDDVNDGINNENKGENYDEGAINNDDENNIIEEETVENYSAPPLNQEEEKMENPLPEILEEIYSPEIPLLDQTLPEAE